MEKVLVNVLLAFLVVVFVNAVLFFPVVTSGGFYDWVNAGKDVVVPPFPPKHWVGFFIAWLPYFIIPAIPFSVFLSWRDGVIGWIAALLALIIDLVIMGMLYMGVVLAMTLVG